MLEEAPRMVAQPFGTMCIPDLGGLRRRTEQVRRNNSARTRLISRLHGTEPRSSTDSAPSLFSERREQIYQAVIKQAILVRQAIALGFEGGEDARNHSAPHGSMVICCCQAVKI